MENKLSDEDIIKAVEVCSTRGTFCKGCPFVKNGERCSNIEQLTIELLKRLQSKIADLLEERENMQAEIERLKNAYREGLKQGKFDSQVKIEELQKKVDELKEENEYLDMCGKQFFADYQKAEVEVGELKEAISQAVKDTAVVVAKEILQQLYDEATCNVSETVELTTFQIEQYAEYYGVVLE